MPDSVTVDHDSVSITTNTASEADLRTEMEAPAATLPQPQEVIAVNLWPGLQSAQPQERFYILARVGKVKGLVTWPNGKPREYPTREEASNVAATLQSRVKVTQYVVVELAEGLQTP
jgi:hypothetical protein